MVLGAGTLSDFKIIQGTYFNDTKLFFHHQLFSLIKLTPFYYFPIVSKLPELWLVLWSRVRYEWSISHIASTSD